MHYINLTFTPPQSSNPASGLRCMNSPSRVLASPSTIIDGISNTLKSFFFSFSFYKNQSANHLRQTNTLSPPSILDDFTYSTEMDWKRKTNGKIKLFLNSSFLSVNKSSTTPSIHLPFLNNKYLIVYNKNRIPSLKYIVLCQFLFFVLLRTIFLCQCFVSVLNNTYLIVKKGFVSVFCVSPPRRKKVLCQGRGVLCQEIRSLSKYCNYCNNYLIKYADTKIKILGETQEGCT